MADAKLLPRPAAVLGATKRGHRIARDVAASQGLDDPHDPDDDAIFPRRPPRIKALVLELFILDKERGVVRLGEVINHAQQDFLDRCEAQLRDRGQIRACVLKARQIGLSTVIEGIAFALSMIHDSFSSLIVSHENDSTQNILAMANRYWQTYVWADQAPAERYASKSELAWMNGSGMKVATAKNNMAGRSRTIHLLHASEVAFWPDPKTLMNGLRSSIPSKGLNAIFLESTANGLGNYFYDMCRDARLKRNEFEFFFYPWHQHPEYDAVNLPDGAADDFSVNGGLGQLDEEEQMLRVTYGVTDSQLLWRRWAIVNLSNNDLSAFHQEYPSSPDEAFISTGRNVFPLKHLLAHAELETGERGDLHRINGKIEFIPNPDGALTVFVLPSKDKDWGVYLCGADPTHSTAGDYACVQVLNRRTLEQVAVYQRKITPSSFADDLALIGYWYNTALIAPEKQGPGYATVGALNAMNYPSLHVAQNVTKMQGISTWDGLAGWATNQQTKHLAISNLVKLLAQPVVTVGGDTYGLVIHDQATLMELRDYVTNEDGTGYQNGDGSKHDDTVMALAIACVVNALELPPPAYTQDARQAVAVMNEDGTPGVAMAYTGMDRRSVGRIAPSYGEMGEMGDLAAGGDFGMSIEPEPPMPADAPPDLINPHPHSTSTSTSTSTTAESIVERFERWRREQDT